MAVTEVGVATVGTVVVGGMVGALEVGTEVGVATVGMGVVEVMEASAVAMAVTAVKEATQLTIDPLSFLIITYGFFFHVCFVLLCTKYIMSVVNSSES